MPEDRLSCAEEPGSGSKLIPLWVLTVPRNTGEGTLTLNFKFQLLGV